MSIFSPILCSEATRVPSQQRSCSAFVNRQKDLHIRGFEFRHVNRAMAMGTQDRILRDATSIDFLGRKLTVPTLEVLAFLGSDGTHFHSYSALEGSSQHCMCQDICLYCS